MMSQPPSTPPRPEADGRADPPRLDDPFFDHRLAEWTRLLDDKADDSVGSDAIPEG